MPTIATRAFVSRGTLIAWATACCLGLLTMTGAAAADSRAQDFEAAKRLLQTGEAARALPLAERAWASARSELPEDSAERAAHAQLVGAVRAALADNAGAEAAYAAALGILERAYGPADPALEPVVRALAIVIERQERWGEAETNYRRSLDLRGKQADPDRVAIANGLVSLSRVLAAQGRDRAAEPPLLRAIAFRRELLGDTHPAVLDSIERLIALQLRIRRRDTATTWLTQGLTILEATRGTDDPEIAVWLMRRAAIATQDLRHDAARADLARAIAIRETAFGTRSAEVAAVWHQIGLGTLDEAEATKALAEALVIRDAVLPPDHPDLGESLIAVARRFDRAGDPGTALLLIARALPIDANAQDHNLASAALLREAGDYAFDVGQPARAAAFASQSLIALQAEPDSDADDEIASRTLLGEALAASIDGDARNLSVATAQLRQAVTIAESAFGTDSLEVADSLEVLARLLRLEESGQEGRVTIERAIGIRRAALGAGDSLLADAQVERARLCALLEDGQACAEEAIRGAVQLRMDIYGIDDPRVADALELQADLFEAWGRLDAARAARERARTIRAPAKSWN